MAEHHRLNHPLATREPLLNTGEQTSNQETSGEVSISLETLPNSLMNRKGFVNIPGLTAKPPPLITSPASRPSSYHEPIPEVNEAQLAILSAFQSDTAALKQSMATTVSGLHCHSGYPSQNRVYAPSVSNESQRTNDSGYLSDSLPPGRVNSSTKPPKSDNAMARFLFAVLKQKNLKDVSLLQPSHPAILTLVSCQIDWDLVANDPALLTPVTNGLAARMRFSRFRSTILNLSQRRASPAFDKGRVVEPSKQGSQSRVVDVQERNPEKKFEDDGSRKLDSRISTPSTHSTLHVHKEVEINYGYGSKPEASPLASIENTDSPPEHNTMQETQLVTGDAPIISSISNDTNEADSTSKDEIVSRSPSPWQTVNNAESEQLLSQSLWWAFKRSSNESLSSRTSIDSFPCNSVEDFPGQSTHGNAITLAAGSKSGSIARTTTELVDSNSTQVAPNFVPQGSSKRFRASNNPNEDSEDEDSEEPDQKRSKPSKRDQQLFRLRFACPYQKFDPLGSPFCCMPSNKNLEGGAETFPRVK